MCMFARFNLGNIPMELMLYSASDFPTNEQLLEDNCINVLNS